MVIYKGEVLARKRLDVGASANRTYMRLLWAERLHRLRNNALEPKFMSVQLCTLTLFLFANTLSDRAILNRFIVAFVLECGSITRW
jgi:hypothetical protein